MATREPTANPQQQQPLKGRGIVRSVLSGDTVVVRDVDKSTASAPVEKQITFSSLSAPRLGRPGSDDREGTPNEPFAWESREFLRKKCIGKRVLYTVEYTTPNGRDYGSVILVDGNESLNNAVISEGWATIFKSTSGKESKRPDMPNLLQLEEAAREAGKGVHNPKRESALTPPEKVEPFQLYNQLKGKQLNGVVEQVRIGTMVRVTLYPTLHNLVVLLSGAQSPGFKRRPDGTQEPEPFAKDARAFIETNVLHRDALITLEGIDKQGNFFGGIEVSGRDVAEELLKSGLASFVGWSATQRGKAWETKLKAAEKSAKDTKKGVWAHYDEKREAAAAHSGNYDNVREFTGRVSAVVNAGTLTVVPEGSNTEVTVTLSSIKVPRASYPGDERDEARLSSAAERAELRAEKAWGAEAKEYLRKKLITQKVRVVLDYVRKAQKTKDNVELGERAYYSVYQGEANVAVQLAEGGFVKVMEYKAGDDRTADYELLLLAENKAKNAHKGWHGPPEKAPVKKVNDLTIRDDRDKEKASAIQAKSKAILPFLERGGPHKAVVDHVFSGGRYKLSVPSQSCIIFFSLSGAKVPKREESEEISNEALIWARSKLHQREVSITVDGVDKGGNFVGELFIGKDNFGVSLVTEGYANLHQPTVDRMKNASQYTDAESKAKKAHKNLWVNYDEEEEKRKKEAADAEVAALQSTAGPSSEFVSVVVTEVLTGDSFYVQLENEESASLDELVGGLTQLSIEEGVMPEIDVRVGDIVRAQFTDDDQWYRAKIVKDLGNDRWLVHYFDYGNSEELTTKRMRVLPPAFRALAPQAQLAHLAFVKAPSIGSEWGRESQQTLRDLTVNRRLISVVEYREGGVLYLGVADEESGIHINTSMVRAGLARVTKRQRRFGEHPLWLKLKEEETAAKSEHLNIWQYGDAPDSDDDEDEPRGAWGKGAPKPAAATAKGAAAAPAAAPAKAAGKKK